jgi:hypothetical protein
VPTHLLSGAPVVLVVCVQVGWSNQLNGEATESDLKLRSRGTESLMSSQRRRTLQREFFSLLNPTCHGEYCLTPCGAVDVSSRNTFKLLNDASHVYATRGQASIHFEGELMSSLTPDSF